MGTDLRPGSYEVTARPTGRTSQRHRCRPTGQQQGHLNGSIVSTSQTAPMAPDSLTVVRVADGADRGEHAGVGELLLVVLGGVLGGFNWSSQRLMKEGCGGQACGLDEGIDGSGSVAVAGEAGDRVPNGSGGVLA